MTTYQKDYLLFFFFSVFRCQNAKELILSHHQNPLKLRPQLASSAYPLDINALSSVDNESPCPTLGQKYFITILLGSGSHPWGWPSNGLCCAAGRKYVELYLNHVVVWQLCVIQETPPRHFWSDKFDIMIIALDSSGFPLQVQMMNRGKSGHRTSTHLSFF